MPKLFSPERKTKDVDLSKFLKEGTTFSLDYITIENNNDWRENVSHTRKKLHLPESLPVFLALMRPGKIENNRWPYI